MLYRITLTGLAGMLFLLLTACGQNSSTTLNIGDEVNLTGTVVDTIDDCVVDGICAFVVDTDRGRINAIWAEGMTRCAGTMDSAIAVGDTVNIRGTVTAADSVSICGGANYFIRIA
jgi:catabolite regulation protein CreA